MNYNYYVEQKYFDSGKVTTKILTSEEAKELNYIQGLFEEHEDHDLYIEGFDTINEAQEFCNECHNA